MLLVLNISLPDDYIEHGNVEVLKEETGISASIILKKVMAAALGAEPGAMSSQGRKKS